MSQIGKMMLLAGIALAIAGAALWVIGRLTGDGWRGLPGDVFHQGERVTVVFPIVTCIVLSAVLTALVWLWQWLSR